MKECENVASRWKSGLVAFHSAFLVGMSSQPPYTKTSFSDHGSCLGFVCFLFFCFGFFNVFRNLEWVLVQVFGCKTPLGLKLRVGPIFKSRYHLSLVVF